MVRQSETFTFGLGRTARKAIGGFWLAEPHWNQGLMTEAIASVNDFAFLTLGIERFHLCNVISNVASRRVKQETGAEFVGTVELPHHSGQARTETWKVTRESWLSCRAAMDGATRRIQDAANDDEQE